MITSTSRYIDNKVALITDPSGKARTTILAAVEPNLSANAALYSWQSVDRIEFLAYQLYGKSELWWVIARANPEILDFTNLTSGTVIRLPNVVPD